MENYIMVKNIKKHANGTFFGEVDGKKTMVIYENCSASQGNISVITGKLVSKKNQNYYYIKEYVVEFL